MCIHSLTEYLEKGGRWQVADDTASFSLLFDFRGVLEIIYVYLGFYGISKSRAQRRLTE